MNAFADCELRIRVTNYPPHYYKDNGQWRGMAVELAETLLNEANCKSTYTIQPWKRALISMKQGKLDMQLNLSITEERKGFIHFIGPQRDESMVLVVNEDSNYEINSLEDIKKLPGYIGIQNGAYYGETFKSKFKTDKAFTEKFHAVTNANQLIKIFRGSRVIGFIMDRYELFYKIKTNELFKGLKAHSFFINQDFVYFGISKKSVSKELLEKLQQAYDNAEAKGNFKRVLERYR